MKQVKKKFCILFSVLTVALMLRLLGINHGLPFNNRIFYETEETYTIQTAMALGSGDLNPHTFNKPSLLYYFIFICYGIFFVTGKALGWFANPIEFATYYFNNTAVFYLIARMAVVLFGVASVYILYLLGKKIYGFKAGIISAFFLATCGMHITYSRYAQADIPQVFFVLLCIYFAVKINREEKILNYIYAGLFAGMAASTKYYGGFVLLAPFTIHFLNKRFIDRRFLLLIISCIAGFILFTPFAILDYKTFLRHLSLTKFWAQDMSLVSGPLPVWSIQYLKDLFKMSNLGIPLMVLSLIGTVYAILKHSKDNIAILFFIFFVYIYFSVSRITWSSIHYLLPIVPLLILLGGALLVAMISRIPQHRSIFIIVASSLFLVHPLIYNIKNGLLLSCKSTTNLAKEWIEENIPAKSKILMDIFYVPQLTLTESSLQRLRKYWRLNTNRTAENLRNILQVEIGKRNKLAELKDRSITENGIPYDVYFIDYNEFLSLDDYVEKYDIQYVILSSWVEDIYNSPFRSARKAQANYFYDSVRKEAILLKYFPSDKINLPGTRLQIYEVPRTNKWMQKG
jgi:hypothetical protein